MGKNKKGGKKNDIFVSVCTLLIIEDLLLIQ